MYFSCKDDFSSSSHALLCYKESWLDFWRSGWGFWLNFWEVVDVIVLFFLLISSMGIDKKANEMMICLSSGCVQKAAAVSIARSRGIDFWGKPNLRVLSSREGRDGEASWRGSSGCPANLVSHLPFSSNLLHFFLSFGAVLFVRHCWLLTVTQEQEKWTGE